MGADIQITPSSPTTNQPVTFTVTNCSNCSDFVWVFKKIGDASVGNGGDGATVTIPFPIAGRYRARVTGTQAFGAYSQYVTAMKEFTVTAAPFTITITPNPNWTVVGSRSQATGGDEINCAPDTPADSSLCTETYLPGEHLILKVILNEGAEFLGWEVNDEIVTDEKYLKMLTPQG